jgi:hypothetical protein
MPNQPVQSALTLREGLERSLADTMTARDRGDWCTERLKDDRSPCRIRPEWKSQLALGQGVQGVVGIRLRDGSAVESSGGLPDAVPASAGRASWGPATPRQLRCANHALTLVGVPHIDELPQRSVDPGHEIRTQSLTHHWQVTCPLLLLTPNEKVYAANGAGPKCP